MGCSAHPRHDPARAVLGGKNLGASPPTKLWDGEKSTRPDLNVKLPESSISATRVLVRSLALVRLGAHVSPIFFEVAKSLTSVSTNQTASPEERRPRWSGSVTTSRSRSTRPDSRNSFVIFFRQLDRPPGFLVVPKTTPQGSSSIHKYICRVFCQTS